MGKSQLFVRNATGLVRSVGPYSGLVFVIANNGFLFVLFLNASVVPILANGVDVIGGALISAFALFFMALVFYYFSQVAPRTGGDYVWVTRWLHPLAGFVSSSIGISFLLILFIGLTGVTLQSTGLSIAFATLGTLLNNSYITGLAPSTTTVPSILLLGTLEIWLPGAIVIVGSKFYFRTQNAVYILIFIIMAALFGVMVVTNPTSFASAFDKYSAQFANTGDYYNRLIGNATSSGWTSPPTSFYNMLLVLPFIIPTIAFGLVTYIGGELKNNKRTWAVSIFGGSFSFLIFETVWLLLAYHAFGFDFLSGLGYLIYNNPVALVLPAIPYLNYLAAIAVAGVPVLVILLALSFVQSIYFMPAATMTTSRAFFAYSFDRLAPTALSNVSARFNSPINAVLLTLALSEAMLFFFAIPFTAAYAFLFTFVAVLLGMIFPYWLLGLTAVLFPYRHRTVYQSSTIRGDVIGLPKIVWAGIVTLVFTTISIYLLLTVPTYGANSPPALAVAVIAVLGAVILFVIAKVVRAKQGIPLDLIFKEIPAE